MEPFSLLLALHIGAGTASLLSGTVAIAVRKGSRSHAKAGIIFSISMLLLAATGAYIGFLKSQTSNIIGGLVTLYLISTAWLTARRRQPRIDLLDWSALLFALVLGVFCLLYGWNVTQGRTVAKDGVPAAMDFFFGFILLLAATGDMRVLIRGGVSGTQRIARHLWRMCLGLFIASGSFFMGRQRIFPEWVRKSNLLVVLTILPLFLLVFWLFRVRSSSRYAVIPALHAKPE